MIPRRYIEEWKAVAPWPNDAQVEQDLVIARALVEIFSDDLLKNHLLSEVALLCINCIYNRKSDIRKI